VNRLALLVVVVAALAVGDVSAEQEVRAIVPHGQQQIQLMGPQGQQTVRGFGGTQAQQVDRFVEASQGQKVANTAAKAVTGVAAAAVSLGAMAAMLMLL